MASIIQIRRDTASDWTSANPTLAQGELGLETDTLKLKAGTGTTAWNSLAYYTLGTAGFLATTGGTMSGGLGMGANDITSTGKILYSNMYAQTSDLPSASTYHGMFAHVHATGKGYFAHGGAWIELANQTDLASATTTAAAALPKAGGVVTGLVNMSDQIVQRPVLKDYSEIKVAMSAHAVDLELGNVFTYTLSGSQTVTFTNPPASGTAGSFTMIVTNGGSATLTWPTSVDFPAATAPTLTASGVDILFFTTCDGGTTWYGTAVLAMG